MEVVNFFFQLLTQLHKLRSQLQEGSSFIWFHFRSSLICFILYTFVIKILVSIPAFIMQSSYSHKYCLERPGISFCLEWLVRDLVPVIPSPPLVKVASNTRPCSKPRRKNFEWCRGRPGGGGGGWVLYLTEMWLATYLCLNIIFWNCL